MTDETNAYAVKINSVTFISMDAAKSIVDEARQDGWNLALEEAAKVADAEVESAGTDQDMFDAGRAVAGRGIAVAIRAMKEKL